MNFELLGKTVICHHMNDPYPVPDGTKGVIQFVDDIGQIHVDWENGSRLALVPGQDSYTIEN
jgi:hypothetical protein